MDNTKAKEMVDSGKWKVEKFEVEVLVCTDKDDKKYGDMMFPTTDGTNKVMDQFGCITQLGNVILLQNRDDIKHGPFYDIYKVLRNGTQIDIEKLYNKYNKELVDLVKKVLKI